MAWVLVCIFAVGVVYGDQSLQPTIQLPAKGGFPLISEFTTAKFYQKQTHTALTSGMKLFEQKALAAANGSGEGK